MSSNIASKKVEWMDETVFERNRLPPRAYYLPEHTSSLSGKWKFYYASNPLESAPSSEKSDAWSLIDVPGHWQLQGWGHPHYTNINFPFPCNPPYVPSDNPTGHYETTFEVPHGWLDFEGGLNFRLRFEGVDSAFHLWLNDDEIGYSQGSRNAAEFSIDKHLRKEPGARNTLRLKVYQWSDGTYLEDQDQWWLSGIFRDVYLLAYPRYGHIEDFFVQTNLREQFKGAYISVSLSYELQVAARVEIKLVDASGKLVAKELSYEIKAGKETRSYGTKFDNPLLWSAEEPNLYHLSITLSSKNQILQQIDQPVGVRDVRVFKGNLRVNGVPVNIRGVNRHDHHPRFGRAVPLDFIRHDLQLMKQHNVNAIRTSHYPNDPRLVQIANELGLYVMDECDLECHGTGVDWNCVPSDKPSWKGAYVERMKQLVHRDKNNPSVIIWSLGNEAFYGQNHAAMYKWSKSYDLTRPVHYEGDHDFVSSDVCSFMYTNLKDLEDLATGEGDDFSKPVILCEYGHAMGNGPGNLNEYVEYFLKYRRLQGGFIWEWANHGLQTKICDGSQKTFYAYGGDFGDEPNDANFVMDGLCKSEHVPSPGLTNLKTSYAPIALSRKGDSIRIKNLYNFSDLSHLEFTWRVTLYSPVGEGRVLRQGVGSFEDSLGPGDHATILSCTPKSLGCKISRGQGETWLAISVRYIEGQKWCDAGHEILHADFRLDNSAAMTYYGSKPTAPLKIHVPTHSQTLVASSSTSSVIFNQAKGRIVQWRHKGIDLISGMGPGLSFWRAPTDNDNSAKAGDWRGWRVNDLVYSTREVRHALDDEGALKIHVQSYVAPTILSWGFDVVSNYTIHGDGALQIDVKVSPKGSTCDTLPRVGLEWILPKDFTHAQWFGLGPGQTYRDFKQASRVGIWKDTVDEMNEMFEKPQETGNRTETRWVKITNERGVGFKAVLIRNKSKRSRASTCGSSEQHSGTPLDKWQLVEDALPANSTVQSPSFDFALSRYTSEDMTQAKHPHELKGTDGVVFRIDDEHHGLGSASCGPDVLDQYQLHMREFDFTVYLHPISP